MKKYLLCGLLILAFCITLVACGTDENSTDVSKKENTEATVETDTDEISSSEDSSSDSSNDATTDTAKNTYEGIDFNSTLPGKEWIQTTFPGVINEPKIVIFNDETNKKQIAEYGEIIIFDEADRFMVYLPNGYDIKTESYLTPRATVGSYYQEEFFDLEKLKEEYEFWKNVDGGALYEIVIHNISSGQEQKLSCIISLGE